MYMYMYIVASTLGLYMRLHMWGLDVDNQVSTIQFRQYIHVYSYMYALAKGSLEHV